MEVDSRATHVTEDRLLRGASFLFNILFCIGLKPINNVVIVSGEQQRDSAIPDSFLFNIYLFGCEGFICGKQDH